MNRPQKIGHNARLEVESDDKTRSLSLDIQQGKTILVDEDPANRTAILDAIQFALGGPSTPYITKFGKSQIGLALGERTYEQEVTLDDCGRSKEVATYPGQHLSASEFAFLHNSSSVRKLATDSDTLQDVILSTFRPDQLKNTPDSSGSSSRTINHQLSDIQALKDELATLRYQREKLQDQIDRMESKLLTRHSEIEWDEATVSEPVETEYCLENNYPGIRETIQRLVELRKTISSKEDRLSELRKELACHRQELSELSTGHSSELDSYADDLDEARKEKQQLDQEIQNVQDVIQFNKGILNENKSDIFTGVGTENLITESSEQSDDDQTVSCWVCNSEVPSTRIETGLESLQTILSQKLEKANEIESRINKLQSAKKETSAEQKQRNKLQKHIDAAETEIQQLEEELDDLVNRHSKHIYKLAQLNADIPGKSIEKLSNSAHDTLTLLLELDRAETKFDDVTQTIEKLEEELNKKEQLNRKRDLESEQDNASDQHIEDLESHHLPQFNTTMDILLQKLDYQPLDRIWIDYRHSTDGDSRSPVFELKAERSSPGSSNGEGTPIDSLCEADTEVATLIFGLAGYLVHEVYDDVEFLLLDSIEFIDSQQIEEMLNYLADFVDYLVVGLSPQEADEVRAETIHPPHSIEISG